MFPLTPAPGAGAAPATPPGETVGPPGTLTLPTVPPERTLEGTLGPRFSFDQLVELWTISGGPQEWANTAAAIALAESGGCQFAKAGPVDDRPEPTCVYRKTTKENSYGLWQVNRDTHPQYGVDFLYSYTGNATAAVAIHRARGNFTDWSTYNDGSYLAYLPGGQAGPLPSVAPPSQHPPAVKSAWASLIDVYGRKIPQAAVDVRSLRKQLIGVMKG